MREKERIQLFHKKMFAFLHASAVYTAHTALCHCEVCVQHVVYSVGFAMIETKC